GITDEEEAAGTDRGRVPLGKVVALDGGGDEDGQLDLDGVGVLELVEEEMGVALVQGAAGRRAGPEQPAGQDQQVVELEPAFEAAGLGGAEDLPADQGQEPVEDVVDDGGDDGGLAVVEDGDDALGGSDAVGPGPIGAGPFRAPVA